MKDKAQICETSYSVRFVPWATQPCVSQASNGPAREGPRAEAGWAGRPWLAFIRTAIQTQP